MDKLFIIEYKAFQPIHETNIICSEPITKKDDKTGIVVTMIKKENNTNVSLNVIVENPNNIVNTITGSLEIPFPTENNVKSQIVKINNVIELILSIRSLGGQVENAIPLKTPTENDFITVSRKTFADRVKGDLIISSSKYTSAKSGQTTKSPQTKLNTYKEQNYPNKVNIVVNSELDNKLKIIIDQYRDSINNDKCFRYNEKSNCLIMSSYKKVDICKQCKNMLAIGAKELDISEYKCNTCSNIVFINDTGIPNFEFCNSCLDKERRKK